MSALGERNIGFEVKTYSTSGDMDKATPISEIEGGDFFTDAIEEALLRGEIDLAVHSAKDLPEEMKEGLVVCATTGSIDSYDVLVSKNDLKLDELPGGAKIGTSSQRRKEQLKAYRSDLRIVDLRGDIEERLRKLEETDLDAIVIAAAGLVRLGLDDHITQRLSFDILRPHPLQGRLAIQVKRDNEDIISLCRACLSFEGK